MRCTIFTIAWHPPSWQTNRRKEKKRLKKWVGKFSWCHRYGNDLGNIPSYLAGSNGLQTEGNNATSSFGKLKPIPCSSLLFYH